MENQPVQLSESQLVSMLIEIGMKLEALPSDVYELLDFLDSIENLFSTLEQNPSRQVSDALLVAAKGLTSRNLLRHPDLEVQVSLLCCIHELSRIAAPDSPYKDETMKEIFEQTLEVFRKLPLLCGRFYAKALFILEIIAKVRSCLVLLDIGCDGLIIQMFKVLLNAIRPTHNDAVFSNMEEVMTLLIQESDEISLDLLKPLLSSMKKENQNVSPLSWRLGEKVLKNCRAKVEPYLNTVSENMTKDIETYTGIVSSLWPEESLESQTLGNVEEIPKLRERPKRKSEEPCKLSGARGSRSSPEVSQKRPRRLRRLPKKLLEDPPAQSKILVSGRTPRRTSHPKKKDTMKDLKQNDLECDSKMREKTTAADCGADESASQGYEKPENGKEYREELIGSRVKVWWPDDQEYYEGVVESYDPSKNEHKVVYFDGDVLDNGKRAMVTASEYICSRSREANFTSFSRRPLNSMRESWNHIIL